MALRTKNSLLLAKIETTTGVDAVPVAGTDAVLVEGTPKISFNPNVTQTNEAGGSLDPQAPIVGGILATVEFDVWVKGSGSAGTAPEYGRLLRACGWAETLLATAVPVAAEACAAGGSTTTAVLGASASSTAQQYRGMPVDFTGTVAGSAFIADYTAGKVATLTDILGGSVVATTNYQIPACIRYAPASTSIPSLTLYVYIDGVLWRFAGARGTTSFTFTSGGPGKITFRFSAMYLGKEDAAVPVATFDATRPPIWKGGKALLNRFAAAMSSLSFDTGAQLQNPDNPNASEGYDPAEITARNITGSVDPLLYLVATHDAMADFRAGTPRVFHARYGTVAGNRVGVTLPAAQATNVQPGDKNGLASEGVQFSATGLDAGAFLTFY